MVHVKTLRSRFVRASVANSFSGRLIGLLGRQSLPQDCGLILERCNSVHTIGMKFPIDVIFLDNGGFVITITSHLKPGRFARCPRAKTVIECNAGVTDSYGLSVGEKLYW